MKKIKERKDQFRENKVILVLPSEKGMLNTVNRVLLVARGDSMRMNKTMPVFPVC